ncbi:hypothetical protein [Saccharothrix sp.]|uniref:hypothetical protein n=1 Tax=Saccharothrix sp. TaxID=1873460 RepID=UPI002812862E|nr:hypothetical protein [Saccharothrix sp.]
MIDQHRLELASQVSKVVDAGRRLVERMLDEAADYPTTEHSGTFEQCVSAFAALAQSVANNLDGWTDEPEAVSVFVVDAADTESTENSADQTRSRTWESQGDMRERPKAQAG